MPRESNIQTRLIQGAHRIGCVADKVVSKSRRGWPDVFIAKAGRVVLVETKTDVGRLSEHQKNVHTKLKSAGVETHVIRTIEQVQALLDSLH